MVESTSGRYLSCVAQSLSWSVQLEAPQALIVTLYGNDSEVKVVILEVLTFADLLEFEIIVGYESRCTTSRLSYLSTSHSTNGFQVCCLTEVHGVSTVSLVF